jgi:hypothetical protein
MSVLYELLGGEDDESPVVGTASQPRSAVEAAPEVREGVGV